MEVLVRTIPLATGYGTGVSEMPGAWWFQSAHPGLTSTLWVRRTTRLEYAIGGPQRMVDVEQERWNRVIGAVSYAYGSKEDAGELAATLHYGREADRPTGFARSVGGPLVVVPASRATEWTGFGDMGERDGHAGLTDYDEACGVEGRAGVILFGAGHWQALVLRGAVSARYLTDDRVFVQWVGADSEDDLFAAARTVLADSSLEWQEAGTWQVDGPAVLMDAFVGGVDLTIEDARRAGMPEPVSVPIPSGTWTVRAGKWTVPTDDEGHATLGLVRLSEESTHAEGF